MTETTPDTFEITINGLVYNSTYHFRISATMPSGRTTWVKLGPISCVAEVEHPQLKLPKSLTKPVKIRVGRKLHLKVPFDGGPKAIVQWRKKDDLDKFDELESHIKIHTVKDATIMFISNCQLWDTGEYRVTLRENGIESSAILTVVVTDFPSKPIRVTINETVGSNAELRRG